MYKTPCRLNGTGQNDKGFQLAPFRVASRLLPGPTPIDAERERERKNNGKSWLLALSRQLAVDPISISCC
jgi:hypothetical protein